MRYFVSKLPVRKFRKFGSTRKIGLFSIRNRDLSNRAGPRFSKAPETFRARKAIFSSSVSTNGEVYTPETSCMKGTSVHIKNT